MAAVAAPPSKYIRTADGQFQCPYCPKICEKQNTMYYHVKKIHLNDLPYECTLCTDMRFLQKSAYLQHVATVHRDAVATAAVSAAAPTAAESNPYIGLEFSCSECSHTTHTKANMIIHYTRSHCRETIPAYAKPCVCKNCERAFASSSAYYYHAATCYADGLPASYAKLFVSATSK